MDNEFDTDGEDQSADYKNALMWQAEQRKKQREYINQRKDKLQIRKADDLIAQDLEYNQSDEDFRKQEKKKSDEWNANRIKLAQKQKAKVTESFYSGNQYGNFFPRLSRFENRRY